MVKGMFTCHHFLEILVILKFIDTSLSGQVVPIVGVVGMFLVVHLLPIMEEVIVMLLPI